MEKVLVLSIAENGQKSIGDTHAIPQKWSYRDSRCDTEKNVTKYRRYQVLQYLIAILTALARRNLVTLGIVGLAVGHWIWNFLEGLRCSNGRVEPLCISENNRPTPTSESLLFFNSLARNSFATRDVSALIAVWSNMPVKQLSRQIIITGIRLNPKRKHVLGRPSHLRRAIFDPSSRGLYGP